MLNEAHAAIEELVDRETRAWDTQNVELLLSLIHPDMVWPWPPTPRSARPPAVGAGVGPVRSSALA